MRTLAASLLATIALAGAARPAVAQGADQKAAAELLFNDARKLMDAGNYALACPKLEQSQQIDPAVGTLGYLANCYEKTGRTASAWATYREAASIAQQRGETERQQIAEARAAELEPNLSHLTIDASAVAGIEGVEILRNGQAVVRGLWSSAVPVDPGEQVIEIRAPGYESATIRVNVAAGGARESAKIPELVHPAGAAAQIPAKSAALETALPPQPPPQSVEHPAPRPARGPIPAQAMAGYFVGGVGIVGLGIGVAFFFDKNSKLSSRDDACPLASGGGDCPTLQKQQDYNSLQKSAETSATVSLVSTLAGSALLATSAVLLMTAPSREQHSGRRLKLAPLALNRGGGMAMETSW